MYVSESVLKKPSPRLSTPLQWHSYTLLGHNRRMPRPKTQRKNFKLVHSEEHTQRSHARMCKKRKEEPETYTHSVYVMLLRIPVKIANSLRRNTVVKSFFGDFVVWLSLLCKSLHVQRVTSFNENRSKWTSSEANECVYHTHTHTRTTYWCFFVELCCALFHICRDRCVCVVRACYGFISRKGFPSSWTFSTCSLVRLQTNKTTWEKV